MNTFALWRLFHRPGRRGTTGHTSLLAIIAFAAATAIFLTVLGGVHGFIWRASADHTLGCMFDDNACAPGTAEIWRHRMTDSNDPAMFASSYVLLAFVACLLLIVPFVALAGSAARLAASRRDARLAALRLAGATNSQVIRLTALDAAGQALVGALIGIIGYCALMPVIMLLRFQNQSFTFEQLWVGPLALILVLLGVTVLALISSLVTLRRVAITPLGVTSRAATALPSAWRAALFVVVLLAAVIIFSNPSMIQGFGETVIYGVVIGFILLCFALVNLVGSWVVTARAKARARRPKNAATMIAMRRILDNPKRAWRNVSGIALAVFIAGITSMCGYIGSMASGANDPATLFLRDIGTGGMLTLVFAAVLAAVSSGVMQAGSVYDQAGEYRMLVLEGTDVRTLNRARFSEVLGPLNIVVLVAGGCAMLLMLPLFASAMTKPTTLLSFFGGIALCYALVSVGAFASNRVAASLNLAEYRADD
jgi:hypothetical protein